jgi:hypothetical protein
MVERPIKKSERQAKIESGEITPPEPTSERPARAEKPSIGKGGGGGGKGKGRDKRDRDDDSKPPANMALMRGPKPVMAKPVVEAPPAEPEATDEATDEAAETPAEG